MTASGPNQQATSFWDREAVQPTITTWMAHPAVRAYINASISGSPHPWPLVWLDQYLGERRFRRGLSIGCGTGALERHLLQLGICDTIDAFDASPESIRVAREQAAAAGLGNRVRYSIEDFNEPRFPTGAYNIVFAHQSLHHVGKLEKLYRAVLRTLQPDGLFYIDEYIGPSRTDWNDSLMGTIRAIYKLVPPPYRLREFVHMPIHPVDPSEALRSSEIVPLLQTGFSIETFRGYGGNLLATLFEYINLNIDGADAIIGSLIEAEQELLSSGAAPFYAVLIARPKKGFARTSARVRYFFVPKYRRMVRGARTRLANAVRRDTPAT